jgi:hypothetical protein
VARENLGARKTGLYEIILNALKSIELAVRQTEVKRVAIVKLRMGKESGSVAVFDSDN